MTEPFVLPADFPSWPKAKKIAYYKSPEIQDRLAERDAAKLANPLAFYKPLPAQKRFHECVARNRLCTGGNRSGKTEAGVVEDLYWILGASPYRKIPKGPLVGVVSAITLGLFETTLLEKFNEYLIKGVIKIHFSKPQGGGTIEGPNGKIYIKSDEAGWKSFQGMALDFAHLDEEHDFRVYKQIRKRLKRGRKLNVWNTMTAEPDRPDHWTYDELYLPAQDSERQHDFAHFEFDLEDNRVSRGGYLDDSEIDHIISITPVNERDAVIHGKYGSRGGRVFTSWKRDIHVRKTETSMKDYLGLVKSGFYTSFAWFDWGVRNPTAIGLVLEDKDGNCRLVDELYRPARDTLDIKTEFHRRWGPFQVSFVVADPSIWHNHDSSNAQDPLRTIAGKLQADDYANRVPGMPLIKGNNSVDDGLEECRDLLSVHPTKGPKFTVEPRCVNFCAEIEVYVGEEWLSRQYERNKKESPKKQKDHHMDGFRYFAMSPHGHDGFSYEDDNSSQYEYDEGGFMRIVS